jgi:predicted nucleic acid-binding protein
MLLDTSFLIDLLQGVPDAKALAEEFDRSGDPLNLPAPSMFELWIGAATVLRSDEERGRLESLALAYDIAPFGADDARQAGTLQAALSKEGRVLGTVDIQLAGMCLARGEMLVTGDRKLATLGHGLRTRLYSRRP